MKHAVLKVFEEFKILNRWSSIVYHFLKLPIGAHFFPFFTHIILFKLQFEEFVINLTDYRHLIPHKTIISGNEKWSWPQQ